MDIPSVPNSLVITILLIKPNALTIKPLNRIIRVPNKKEFSIFFILNITSPLNYMIKCM